MNSTTVNFQNIVNSLYGHNPYLGFEAEETTDIRKINEPTFEFLIQTLSPNLILEVGSWKGSSAIKMAEILEQYNLKDSVIICVDTWLGSPEHWLGKEKAGREKKWGKEWGFNNLKVVNGFPTIYRTFLSNVINSSLQHKIIPFPQTSENAAVIFQRLNLKFDLIYIDAAHEYEPVGRDLQAYYNLLSDRGIIFGDDYPGWDGVRQAVNDFAAKFDLKIYSKSGKYVLIKPEQDLVGFDSVGLSQGAIKSVQEIIELGLEARKQKKEQEALQYFEQAIKAYPPNVPAYVEAGKSLKVLQKLSKAKQRFEQALQKKPDHLEALMELGNIAYLEKEWEKALEKFQAAIKYRPNNSDAYVQAGKSLKNLGRLEEAKERFEQALQKKADHLEALMELGNIAYLEGKWEKALEKFQTVIKYHPNYLNAYVQAAIQLRELKRFVEADEIADLGLSQGKNQRKFLPLLKEKGFALASQLKLREASEVLKKFVRLGGNVWIFFDAAIVLTTQEMFDPAILLMESNLPFLKKHSDNWLSIQGKIITISRAKDVYESQIKKAKNHEKYKIIDVRPQKYFLNFPLKVFSKAKVSQDQPSFFSTNIKLDNIAPPFIAPLFDDLGGLLSVEIEFLSKKDEFKQPASNNLNYGIFTLPNACFMHEWIRRLPFSLDGYFIPNVSPRFYKYKRSHHALIREIDRALPCGFFLPTAGQNYYHILCEIMPPLSIYQELGLNCPIVLPLTPQAVHKKIFQFLDIPSNLVMSAEETDGIVFDIGIACPPPPLSVNLVSFYGKIAAKILEEESIKVKKSDRIYISRRNSSNRPLLNEDKIEELLSLLGFSIYYMENCTFEEQIAIAAHASIVVAPHGAGLTNILFCQPGTKIVELMMDKYPHDGYYKLALLCGHKYYPILGKLEENTASKWKVDIEKVRQVVEKLIT
jgi:capsular polysaccharide biosynthesis protein/tetratricopeptide (TPR) repeat protein